MCGILTTRPLANGALYSKKSSQLSSFLSRFGYLLNLYIAHYEHFKILLAWTLCAIDKIDHL